jgi:mercuric reductase
MMKTELRFEGMTCLECSQKLEKALQSIPGVESAEVSYPAKSGKVTGSDDVSRDELLRVVERAGYRAEIVDGGPGGRVTDERGEGRIRKAATTGEADAAPGGHNYDLLIVGTGGAGTPRRSAAPSWARGWPSWRERRRLAAPASTSAASPRRT